MTKNIRSCLMLAVVFLTALLPVHAQVASVPQGINYQSVARNASGQILTNQRISLRLTIHDSNATGASIYSEGHTVTTNAFGTFGVVIGGGSIILGNFNTISWGAAIKYLQVEMDFAGGTNYTSMGASELMSVPYALYASASTGDLTNIKYDTSGILNAQTAAGNIISTPRSVWLTAGNANLTTINNFIGTTDNVDFILKRGGKEGVRFTTGGAFLATGDTATGITPVSGAGRRMMWIPAKGAFRAGSVTGTAWDNANIGANSTAIGNNALASGANTLAIGNNAQAICANSIAMGNGVITKSANSMVVGSYNDTSAGSAGGISQSDVLFQVGNGASAGTRANALTVSKTGQVVASQLLVSQSMTLSDTILNVSSNFTLSPNYAFVIINSSVSASNAQLTLNAGSHTGQMILIEVNSTGSGNNGVRLLDNTANGLNISQNNLDIKSSDTVTLLWDGSIWVELSTSSNH